MASLTPNAAKPDWMSRLGLGLWIVVGWGTFRVLGWHIPSWVWIAVLITGAGILFQYIQILEAGIKHEREREFDELKGRVEEMENLITHLRREIREGTPEYLMELRKQTLRD